MNKIFIFRNHTIEHLFKGFEASFSGYDDILTEPENPDFILWFYSLKISANNKNLANEVDSYFDRLKIVIKNNENKKFIIFLLSSRLIKYFKHTEIELSDSIKNFNNNVLRICQTNPYIQYIDINLFFDKYSNADLIDWKFFHISNMIINPKLSKDFRSWFSRRLKGLSNNRKKCIVLDLDNTLWGGVVGEDGVSGISIGDTYPGNAFLLFQENLIEASKNGIILTVCSKNNLSDIEDVWNNNPFVKLNKNYLSSYRINWKNKASNILEISEELNIGVDSIVFIDDNPAERLLVKKNLPDLTVPDFPKNPYDLEIFFRNLMENYFQVYNITEEDKNKVKQYNENSKRKKAAKMAFDIKSFLSDLKMELKVLMCNKFTIDRISNMTQKTNQFNLTTKRYTQAELQDFINKGSLIYCLNVKDKFGDNGITVAAIIHLDNEEATFDSFLLSCRILGRNIEKAFIKYILNTLFKKGIYNINAKFIPTKKNIQTKDFYDNLDFHLIEEKKDGTKIYKKKLEKILKIDKYYNFI